MTITHPLDVEVDANYDAFERQVASLLQRHEGEFVLMRGGEIVAFHASEAKALAAGRTSFSDGRYSVQEITRRPADLGFFSHAIDTRLAG